MTMDVSMYGHHNQHSSSYNSPDNYLNTYSSDLNHTSYQFQNSYPSNYPYDETYVYTSTECVDSPASPQELNYYNQPHPQENPIINTDTGLSYTNLDYTISSGSSGYHNYNENYPRSHSEGLLHHEEPPDGAQLHHSYLHETKYHQVELSDTNFHHSHMLSPNGTCMEFQHLHRYKEEMISDSHGRLRQHQLHGLNVSQAQPVLPTYKWMQVKRNVPKPCKFLINVFDFLKH